MKSIKYIMIIVALLGMYYAKTKIDDQNKAKQEMIESFEE